MGNTMNEAEKEAKKATFDKMNKEKLHPGIHLRFDSHTYLVYISHRGHRYYLGTYNTYDEALAVRKAAEIRYWKEDYTPPSHK
jgi:hypothetical protein